MALTKTNLRMMDTGFITPLDFGAAGNGSTDDGPALQLALNASDYSVIDLAGKTYATNQQLTLTRSNVTLRNGTIKYTGTSKSKFSILKINGTDSTATALAVNASTNIGDHVVSLADSSSISVGDFIKIAHNTDASDKVSDNTKYAEDGNTFTPIESIFFGDMQQVIANNATTEDLTLLNPVLGKLTSNSKVTKLSSVLENINITNVTFQGNALVTVAVANNGFANAGTSIVTVTTSANHNLLVGDYVYFGNGDTSGSAFQYDDHVRGERVVSEVVDATNFKYASSGSGSAGTQGGSTAEAVSGLNRALEISYCSDVYINRCTFKDCPGGIVEVNYVNNCIIDSNMYTGPAYPEADIVLLGNVTPYLTIANNRIYGGRGGNGITTPQGQLARRGVTYQHTGAVHCLIKDNKFIGLRGEGISLGATSVRSKIIGNYISKTVRFTEQGTTDNDFDGTAYHKSGILAYANDIWIEENTIETAGFAGILVGNGEINNAILGEDITLSNLRSNNTYIPFQSIVLKNNKLYKSLNDTFATHGIFITTLNDNPRSSFGNEITGNKLYGFPKGIMLSTVSGVVTTSDSIIANNIIGSLPASSQTDAYCMDIFLPSSSTMKRVAISNNIFFANTTGVSTKYHNIETNRALTNCSFGGNIFNFEGGGAADKAHVYFNDPTSTGSAQLSIKNSFIGNVFSGAGGTSALMDISVGSNSSTEPYSIGHSLDAVVADYGNRYGLNVWSIIDNAGWPGPN